MSYEGLYAEEWEKMYPGREFPSPEKYPHMYAEGSKTEVVTIIEDPINPQCSNPRTCRRGLIDYQCQYENSCYLNLLELFGVMLGFFLGFLLFLFVFFKLLKLLYNVFTTICFLQKIVGGIACCLTSCSCYFLQNSSQEIVLPDRPNPIPRRNQILEKFKQVGLQVDLDRLNKFQLDRILQIIDIYEYE